MLYSKNSRPKLPELCLKSSVLNIGLAFAIAQNHYFLQLRSYPQIITIISYLQVSDKRFFPNVRQLMHGKHFALLASGQGWRCPSTVGCWLCMWSLTVEPSIQHPAGLSVDKCSGFPCRLYCMVNSWLYAAITSRQPLPHGKPTLNISCNGAFSSGVYRILIGNRVVVGLIRHTIRRMLPSLHPFRGESKSRPHGSGVHRARPMVLFFQQG